MRGALFGGMSKTSIAFPHFVRPHFECPGVFSSKKFGLFTRDPAGFQAASKPHFINALVQ
jgi:hypothetical protein